MSAQPRLVEVRQKVLKQNDVVAREMRRAFAEAGTLVVSLVSSPGSGKTELLEKTLRELAARAHSVAALVGDLATDNDAVRLARSGAPVSQIVTGSVCHLEAEMVRTALAGWNVADFDFLFLENVGNLVCPASYDLGEDFRVVLMSTTEGEDKPLKYPTIFNTADIAVITKCDLARAVVFNHEAALAAIRSVRPGMITLELSARLGDGMEKWIELLESRRSEKHRSTNKAAPQPAAGS